MRTPDMGIPWFIGKSGLRPFFQTAVHAAGARIAPEEHVLPRAVGQRRINREKHHAGCHFHICYLTFLYDINLRCQRHLSNNAALPSKRSVAAIALPLVLIVGLFFLWEVANNLNDVLIPHFRKAFSLTDLQSGLVQSAFYLGYFLLAHSHGHVRAGGVLCRYCTLWRD
jgi:hypothetical protein